jgi:hypothetical protein
VVSDLSQKISALEAMVEAASRAKEKSDANYEASRPFPFKSVCVLEFVMSFHVCFD